MQDYPCSNYTVNAKDFLSVVPKSQRKKFQSLLDHKDTEKIADFLVKHIKNLPPIVDVNYASDFYTSDTNEWTQGDIFVEFDEEVLYKKIPTKGLTALLKMGITPKFSRWTVYG